MVTNLSALPNFEPGELTFLPIPTYRYQSDLKSELAAGTVTDEFARALLERMLAIREFEMQPVYSEGN